MDVKLLRRTLAFHFYYTIRHTGLNYTSLPAILFFGGSSGGANSAHTGAPYAPHWDYTRITFKTCRVCVCVCGGLFEGFLCVRMWFGSRLGSHTFIGKEVRPPPHTHTHTHTHKQTNISPQIVMNVNSSFKKFVTYTFRVCRTIQYK